MISYIFDTVIFIFILGYVNYGLLCYCRNPDRKTKLI